MERPTIIMVDDEELNLELMKEYCSNIQANIIAFFNSEDALEYARENRCDIAFIDYMMPEMNGLELTRKLKEILPDIFIIMITSSINNAGLKLEVLKNGASEFLNKPMCKAEFIARVKNAIELVNARNTIKNSEEEKKLRTIFDILPVGIAIMDNNQKFIETNSEMIKLFLGSKKELLNKKYEEIEYYDAGDRKMTMEELGRILLTKEKRVVKDFEIKIKKSDGEEIWTSLAATPIPIEECGIVITITDITKQKKLEKELIKAKEVAETGNKAKIAFIANMSHEMRTPLFHILGYSDLLCEEKLEDEIHEMVTTIKDASTNLLEMINNVLEYSQIEAGLEAESIDRVDINEIVKEVDKIYRKFAVEKGLNYTTKIDASLSQNVNLDRFKIKKIATNLISNAVKFTKKGYIEVNFTSEIENNENYLVLRVKDTGIGIAENKMDGLYELFEQGEYFLTKTYGGIGIGLAVAKRLTELLRGTMDVKSSVKDGTTVTVKIPLENMPMPELTNGKEEVASIKKYDIKILVAEDNETTIILLKKMLAKIVNQIDIAVNGREAVEKARTNGYDLILMDIGLPLLNGLEVAKILRNDGINIPIIAITGYNSIKNIREGLEAGMNDYISKPFDFEILINAIDRIMK